MRVKDAARANPAQGRIRLKDDGNNKKGAALKPLGGQIRVQEPKYAAVTITEPRQVRFREKNKKLSQHAFLKPRRVRVCKI
jgi:hypothetical protein